MYTHMYKQSSDCHSLLDFKHERGRSCHQGESKDFSLILKNIFAQSFHINTTYFKAELTHVT